MILQTVYEFVFMAIFLTVIFTVDAQSPGCVQGRSNAYTGGTRIVGGVEAEKGEIPWMAALFRKYAGKQLYNTRVVLCGASLISKTHLLSAAHCFDTVSVPSDILVRLGMHRISTSPSDAPEMMELILQSIVLHEAYDPIRYTDDIAMIKLAAEVQFTDYVRPIYLPVNHIYNFEGALATTSGWGVQKYRKPSDVLLKVDVDVVSNELCIKSYESESFVIDDRTICAGFQDGTKDNCQGDSGGPLFTILDGYPHLIGIVSTGYRCAEPHFYGVHTRITAFLPWIQHHHSYK